MVKFIPALALLSVFAEGVLGKNKVDEVVRRDGGAVAAPAVTPRAVLPRADEKTVGWYSYTTNGSETIYTEWTYDGLETTFKTSSTWFRRCEASSSCTIYTGCSSGYLVNAGTSSFCGTGGGSSSLFCSHHISLSSVGASDAYSWYWCDLPPLTGITFYGQNPDATATPLSPTSTGSSAASTTSAVASASSSAPSATASSPAGNGGSNNTGIIAGSVVGGVAVIVALAVLCFCCCCRRHRKEKKEKKDHKTTSGATITKHQRKFSQQSHNSFDPPEKPDPAYVPYSQNAQPEYYPQEKQDHQPTEKQPTPFVSPMLNQEDEYVQRGNARFSAVSPIIPDTHNMQPMQPVDEHQGLSRAQTYLGEGTQQQYDAGEKSYWHAPGQYTQRPWV